MPTFIFSRSGELSLSSSSTSSAQGCFCSSASSIVGFVWASPLLNWPFTISSSSCIGIINTYSAEVGTAFPVHSIYDILGWRKYLSQSLNLGGRRGTTDDVPTIPFHPSLSSAALRESPHPNIMNIVIKKISSTEKNIVGDGGLILSPTP